MEAVISYLHYLGFMTLFAALVAQHLLFATEVSRAEAIRLATLDGIAGIAALLILVTGALKVFAVGTPAAVYAQNPFFHAKVTLFVVIALLSIIPTRDFLVARKQARAATGDITLHLPRRIVMIQRIELLGVALLPLLAACMVRL